MLENKPHCGRPPTSVNAETTSKVKELVHANQQIIINEVVSEVGISCGSAQASQTEESQMIQDEMRWILHHDNATATLFNKPHTL
jgi:hypothetical protein